MVHTRGISASEKEENWEMVRTKQKQGVRCKLERGDIGSNIFQRRLSKNMRKELRRIDKVMKRRGFIRKDGQSFTEEER
jgi:hypothetical protein